MDHKLWIEDPEDIPTCIALRPYPKDQVQKYFKKLRMFKGPPPSEQQQQQQQQPTKDSDTKTQ